MRNVKTDWHSSLVFMPIYAKESKIWSQLSAFSSNLATKGHNHGYKNGNSRGKREIRGTCSAICKMNNVSACSANVCPMQRREYVLADANCVFGSGQSIEMRLWRVPKECAGDCVCGHPVQETQNHFRGVWVWLAQHTVKSRRRFNRFSFREKSSVWKFRKNIAARWFPQLIEAKDWR